MKKTWFDLHNHATGFRLIPKHIQEVFLSNKNTFKTADDIYEQRMLKKDFTN